MDVLVIGHHVFLKEDQKELSPEKTREEEYKLD